MSSSDKVAVVTGAARGIGKAIARRFAEDGLRVVLADIDEKAGEDATRELIEAGHEALFQYCDVGERLDVRNLICTASDRFGSVDIMVNNAGTMAPADFLQLSEGDFDRVIRTNLKGCFLGSQLAGQQMVEQIEAGREPGTIINMSSVNSVLAIPEQAAYAASKAGINQLTRAASLALAPWGIRVNAIGPGSIDTDMLSGIDDPDMRERLLSRTPLGRIGRPEEVAAIAAFLAGPDASYMTGQTVYVDGGRLGLNYTVPVKPGTTD